MSGRDRILGRIREALAERPHTAHPGAFGGWRPTPLPGDPVAGFTEVFTGSGGEVLRAADGAAARKLLGELASPFNGVVLGATVPTSLDPGLPAAPVETAALGISFARAAVAETGSLVLDARDGRRTQLLPPTHIVLLRAGSVHATLVDALNHLRSDLPSALGLHSGPSKSADIGQVLVKGVHGPGRVIALILDGDSQP